MAGFFGLNIASRYTILLMLFVFSCKGDDYLYDKVGFDAGERPVGIRPNPSAPVKISPDYYYRQAPVQQPYYQQGYAPAPQQQYQQQYNPYQDVPYPTQAVPRSRTYANPYAIPPSSQYPYYDADQYYVPPTYYGNEDPNAVYGSRPQNNTP